MFSRTAKEVAGRSWECWGGNPAAYNGKTVERFRREAGYKIIKSKKETRDYHWANKPVFVSNCVGNFNLEDYSWGKHLTHQLRCTQCLLEYLVPMPGSDSWLQLPVNPHPERQRGSQRQIFVCWFLFFQQPAITILWYYKLKPETWKSVQISHVVGWDLRTRDIIYCTPGCTWAVNCTENQVGRIGNKHSNMECGCPEQ